MPIHCCLDPQDPYAEHEVQVAFEWTVSGPRLIVALDQEGEDILPDLVAVQRDDLCREIAATLRGPAEPPRLRRIGLRCGDPGH